MRAALACALLLAALPAAAAGPAEGRATAAAEAALRAEGSELVEIEGFTGPDGDIPCAPKSFANAWHYKFRLPAAEEWLIVNACGEAFVNAARHYPYRKSAEPTQPLPYSFAAPAAVLKKLKDEGLFSPEPNRFSRDVRMLLRMRPAKDGRPAGCYWEVSQGKAAAAADCAAQKAWKLGKAAAAAKAGAAKKLAAKGRDAAGRYLSVALDAIKKKDPAARLVLVEGLADRTGSAKCIGPMDGWTFVFASDKLSAPAVFGCGNKTAMDLMDFDGKRSGAAKGLDPLPLPFKDSDFALAQAPACAGYATVPMKLKNFRTRNAPFPGHNFVWTIGCGSSLHYVDAQTGLYLGSGKP